MVYLLLNTSYKVYMEYAYPIMSGIFGAVLLLYALTLYNTKDYRLIARGYAAKMKDPKRYTERFAGVIAWLSAGPLVSAGLYLLLPEGSFRMPVTLFVLFAGFSVTIWRGFFLMRDEY